MARWPDGTLLLGVVAGVQLALKHEELVASKAEVDKRAGQVQALQAELDKQSAAIKDMQVRGQVGERGALSTVCVQTRPLVGKACS